MNYFSEKRFFTVLNSANCVDSYEFETGINDLRDYFDLQCYFIEIENIFLLINKGSCFREVFIPSNVPFIHYDNLYWWDYVKLGEVQWWNPKTIKWLIENGADISVGDYLIVQWALQNNFEVFYFLQEYICNINEDLWTNIVHWLGQRGLL